MGYPTYKVKAGRFAYDSQTKKVKVCKDKGLLTFTTNEEAENHVSWVNLDKNVEEMDIIVFAFDVKFEQVAGQKNTFVLRFDSNEDKYFFYLQEKIDPEEFVKQALQRVTFTPEEEIQHPQDKMEIEHPQDKMEIQHPVKNQQPQPQLKGFDPDFLARLTNNLKAASKSSNDITHLSKILTPQVMNSFLSQLTQDEKNSLLEYLPDEQKGVQFIASNIRSPQFQQSADTLSDALNSENVIPLFMEMGLDQKHLKKHYGVHAFLIALIEWAQKQQ